MSMRHPFLADSALTTVYAVAAPCRTDALRVTLQSAYGEPNADDPFADLVRVLDRVEYTARQI